LQELNQSESVLRARAIVAFHLGNFRQNMLFCHVQKLKQKSNK
jgi:hypothetical protein